MTAHELHSKLEKGYSDIEKGNIYNAATSFSTFRNNYQSKKRSSDMFNI